MEKPNHLYTYADDLQWPKPKRVELIHGVPYNMTPALSRKRQSVLLNLAGKFADYLDDKSCDV